MGAPRAPRPEGERRPLPLPRPSPCSRGPAHPPCSPAHRPVAPPPPAASHLRVVAAHLAPVAGGGAEVVVLALVVPLLHGQRHVQALLRDGEQVLAAPPALLVVAPHALLRVGLGEGGQLLVPPLRGRSGREVSALRSGRRGEGVGEGGGDQRRRSKVSWGPLEAGDPPFFWDDSWR